MLAMLAMAAVRCSDSGAGPGANACEDSCQAQENVPGCTIIVTNHSLCVSMCLTKRDLTPACSGQYDAWQECLSQGGFSCEAGGPVRMAPGACTAEQAAYDACGKSGGAGDGGADGNGTGPGR
jgi:hypothetical protein